MSSAPTIGVRPVADASEASSEEIRTDTLVAGAGPAGLAAAACLRRREIPFELVERAEHVGAAWRRHYDRLHLHTAKRHSGLPHYPMPDDFPRYPSRDQVVEYLEMYARRFDLAPRLGEEVEAARFQDGFWTVATTRHRYRVRNLIVATGQTRAPHVPYWPGRDAYAGRLLHSSAYRTGAPFAGQRALVVGFGNSGGEIALDLVEHGADTHMAVRSPVNVIPKELFGLPILSIAIHSGRLPAPLGDALTAPILRLLFGDLERYGLRRARLGPRTQVERKGRIPLIDVGTIEQIKAGQITVHGGIERFTDAGVVFEHGAESDFDVVVLATGYRPRVTDFLQAAEAALDEQGAPRVSGRETAVPGLYFCGFYTSPTGMLREVGIEAERIAAHIAAKQHRAARLADPAATPTDP